MVFKTAATALVEWTFIKLASSTATEKWYDLPRCKACFHWTSEKLNDSTSAVQLMKGFASQYSYLVLPLEDLDICDTYTSCWLSICH